MADQSLIAAPDRMRQHCRELRRNPFCLIILKSLCLIILKSRLCPTTPKHLFYPIIPRNPG
jgi:hypothetical protein